MGGAYLQILPLVDLRLAEKKKTNPLWFFPRNPCKWFFEVNFSSCSLIPSSQETQMSKVLTGELKKDVPIVIRHEVTELKKSRT